MNCPYGRVNDPYPGLCSLYIDENNNQICDLSEKILGQQVSGANNVSSPIFWYIFVPAVLYFLHWYFYGRKNPVRFKFFWNVILLLLFVPAGIFGLLLALGIKNQFLLSWHSNFGVSFVIVSFIHVITRSTYFLRGWRIFKK